jgi:two-component system, NtrC family, response regulator PilR
MVKLRILVVDDEEGMLEVCADTLSALPYASVVTELSSRRALARIQEEAFDLLISDIRMPGVDGVELLRAVRERDATLPALMLTAYPTVDTAVEAMKLGASDYITKPFRPEDLLSAARRLLETRRLHEENQLLQRQLDRRHSFDDLVGATPAMQALYDIVERVAETDADVLILGETGTGKELVARAIHRRSARGSARFVPVDCGAIPDSLMESEVFGHERGAFTGANARSLGLLEFAHRGTFFLDEVAELPVRLQAKLLRVLQERRVRRVGSTQEIEIDVRTLAATSRDLPAEIREGRFREDLYYRINVACIELPALRERAEDIPLLVDHFVERFAPQMGRAGVELEPEVIELLLKYPWPGNVRELQNVVKRLLAMSRANRITPEDLPEEIVLRVADAENGSAGTGFFEQRGRQLGIFEAEYLTALMKSSGGDATQAAREARIPRGTLYRLLKKHGISPADFR